MNKYTVLLLVPDMLAANYGEDIYTNHSTSPTPEIAVTDARKNALTVYEAYDLVDKEDFGVIAVFAGHLDNLNPEAI